VSPGLLACVRGKPGGQHPHIHCFCFLVCGVTPNGQVQTPEASNLSACQLMLNSQPPRTPG